MNLHYKKLTEDDYDKMIALWNRNMGILFPMDDKLFSGNLKMDKDFDEEYVLGAYEEEKLIGFIIYKRHVNNLGMMPPDKKGGNINSIVVDFEYRNMGIGSTMLKMCEEELKSEGVDNIELGRDTFHFFPGVPKEYVKSLEFFKKRGYDEEFISYDVACDVSNINLDEIRVKKGLKLNTDERFVFQELSGEYKQSLMDFLKRTFPGRWYGDTTLFFKNGMEYRDIIVVIDKKENKVVGFGHVYDKHSKLIGPPAYWRGLLGENFGGLGPIGVDTEYRKMGLGLTLLYKCMEIQKEREVHGMCIDWTDLLDFYGIFNFMPWKTYVHMNKKF